MGLKRLYSKGWLISLLSSFFLLILILQQAKSTGSETWEPVLDPAVTIIEGRGLLDRNTQTFIATVSVQNNSAAALSNPLRLVVEAANKEVIDADGSTDTGEKYYFLNLPSVGLLPGAGASKLLRFQQTGRGGLAYQVRLEQLTVSANTPPLANAGPDKTVYIGDTVSLDGSGSSDADGDVLSFMWSLETLPAGSLSVLDDPHAVNPKFVVDVFGTYIAELKVSDGLEESAPDSVRIDTDNSKPVADAGASRTLFVGDTATLDGSGSSDVDGDPLTWHWSLSTRPEFSTAAISDSNAINPSFQIDLPGTYVAQLIVNDGTVDSLPDTVVITTLNSLPVAKAGSDQSLYIGDWVQLDGSKSSDADLDSLNYFWSLTSIPNGSSAQLTDAYGVAPKFLIDLPGNYVAQLIVNDGSADSAPDTVTVSTLNSRPVACIAANDTGYVGEQVLLDGGCSSDADADPLSYFWSLLTLPANSAVSLSGIDQPNASFVPDVEGLYVVQLIVDDGELEGDPDTARIEILVRNRSPEITSTPPLNAFVGVPYSYELQATDAENDPIAFSLTEQPQGMSIDSAAGVIQWTPKPAQLGNHPVTAHAADSRGAAVTQSFTVIVYSDCTVLPPGATDACAITGLSTDRAPPGAELTILGYGFDPDPARNRITVGGVESQAIAIGPDGITVRVPLTGTNGAVTVETPRGALTGPEFTIDRAQDFALYATPAAVDLLQGSRRSLQIEAGNAGTAEFRDAVELTAGGLPGGVSLEFLPAALTVGRKGSLLVTAGAEALPGLYNIEVRGTGYTSGILQTRNTSFDLRIQPNPDGMVTGVSGRFVTPEGAGIPGVIVRAEPVGAYGTSLGQTVTDAAGDFLLSDLPAGILILRIDSTPADPGYPIFPVSVTIEAGAMTRLNDWVLRHQPPDERFTPIQPGSTQEQVVTDPRYPGLEVRLPANTSIIGWDGVPKTRMAVERIEPDRLPVDPPLVGAKSFYQLFFGTPMGGVPSSPILVTLPNELGLDPGEKADLWYFDGAPTGEGLWKTSGTGTVSADGSVIVTDPGSGIPRFCGVCGLSCFIRQGVIPNPPCPDCDPQGPPQKAGKPVTLALGMELSSVVDLQIDGVMPITIGRVYNPWNHFVNNVQLQPSFGHGWYASYDVGIYGVGAALRVVMPGNGRIDFQPNGSGDWVAPEDLRFGGARLTTRNGGLEMVFKDGRVWRFTYYGLSYLLTQQLDGKGNSLRIERNGAGRPTTITAPGRSVAIGIGSNGYIEGVRDELGRSVRYAYNAEGRLAQVTAPDGGVTGYSYVKPPPPRLLSVSGTGGGTSGGFVVSVSSSFGPGTDGPAYIKTMTFPGVAEPLVLDYGETFRVLRETLGNQMELRFSYELSGTCAIHQSKLNLPSHSCAGPNGPTVESWDTVQAGWHFFGGTVSATRVTDANGNGFKVRFNGANLGIELEDAEGQITSYARDANNRITAVTDPLGRTTRYEYDGSNNITRIVEPTGRTTDLGYDPKWNKVSSITRTLDDGTPVTYRFEYDQQVLEFGLLVRAIDPLGNVTEYGYTNTAKANNLIDRVTDPHGRVTRLGYSDRGDLTSVTDPLGNAVSLQHDALGRLLQVTDALGATTRSDYNLLDQVTRIVDANGGQTGFSYDAKRDPKSVVDPLDRAVETYVTDILHRLTRRTDAAGADETYQYDAAGRLVSAVDRKGQQVSLSYDRLDRVTRIDYADGNAETRAYDAVGRLVRITDAAGTIAFEYDDLDRLVKETTEHGGAINSVEYRYDALDRLVERTVIGADPTSYSYDLASRLESIGFRGATVTYEWDEVSRLNAKTLPNGTRQEYAYDDADRLLEIRFVRSDGGLIDRIAYQYDANGRRIGKTTGLPSNDETPIVGTYDGANRMTSVTFPGAGGAAGETCSMDYDANGNLTAKVCPGGTTTYTWDAQDRLIAIDGPDVAADFRYDALGRRIERTVNGVTTGYLYDGVQAIAEFGADDAALLTGLAIDEALGRFAGSGELTLLTDALGSVVAEARGDESVATRYGYSPYGETVIEGEESGSSTRYTGREEDGIGVFYYRTRYFSPLMGAFLSEDWDTLRSGDLNVYRYVASDPLNLTDPLGMSVRSWISDKLKKNTKGAIKKLTQEGVGWLLKEIDKSDAITVDKSTEIKEAAAEAILKCRFQASHREVAVTGETYLEMIENGKAFADLKEKKPSVEDILDGAFEGIADRSFPGLTPSPVEPAAKPVFGPLKRLNFTMKFRF